MNTCRVCGAGDAPHTTGGPPYTPEEEAEIAAFNASYRAADGSPIYHTGHLPTRLLRLPIHHYCDAHKPR